MKKIILTFAIALSMISCTNETLDVTTEAIVGTNLTAKKTVTTPTVIPNSGYTLETYLNCNDNCIAKDSQTYFAKDAEQTVSWGGPDNDKFSKIVYIKYFNTETHFVLQVLSTVGYSDLVIDGISSGIKAAENTWANYTFPLKAGWKSCDTVNLRLQVAANGPQGVFDVNYALVGLCPETRCSYSQGYFFANGSYRNGASVLWTNKLTIGGVTYDQAQGRVLWDANNGPGKDTTLNAFFQLGAVRLSGVAGAVAADAAIIDKYFNGINAYSNFTTLTNFNLPAEAGGYTKAEVKAAGSRIEAFISANHCTED